MPAEPLTLTSPVGAPFGFVVEIEGGGDDAPQPPALNVTGPDPRTGAPKTRAYRLADWEQPAWVALHQRLAADFGTRPPGVEVSPREDPGEAPRLRPLLTANIAPEIRYGYGDPCVVRTEAAGEPPRYHLVVTSNDAPGAFPILRSADLERWEFVGCAFPPGRKPRWAAGAPVISDFWAPELHRVGEEFWLCFSARRPDRSLAIGIARSPSPEGPFETPDEPLIGGGVIDAHLLVDDGEVHLFWKADNNGIWPGLLDALLHQRPELIARLFPGEADQRTLSLLSALQPWTARLEPMRRFLVHGPLIEAVTDDLPGFKARLQAAGAAAAPAAAIAASLRTPVYAQRVSEDGRSLVGEPTLVLENDQLWEAHLIEGSWIWREAGRSYFFYSGNDFATPQYGIGVAVADHPLGPYRKAGAPLLRSSRRWIAPGHPSVALAPDGRPHLFLHAYPPGEIGYKAFRALLSVPLRFDGDRVMLE